MNKTDELRKRAEEKLRNAEEKGNMDKDVTELIHELKVHQIELQMQNEELRKSQEEVLSLYNQYYELYDHAPVGYFSLDKDGIIRNVNVKGAELLQLNKKKIIGRGFSRFISKDGDKYYCVLANAIDTNEIQSIELQLKGNKTFYAYMEIMIVHNSDERYRVTITDITKRKKAEDELKLAHEKLEKESEEKLRTYITELEESTGEIRRSQIELDALHRKYHDLFNTAPVGYITLNSKGIITEVNDTMVYLTGFQKSSFNMNAFILFVAPKSRDAFYRVLNNANAVKRQTTELELTKIDDTTFCALTEFVFSQEDKQFKLAITDISERKKGEEELNETINELNRSNYELESFAFITSHDLQEPLRTIASFAQLIERRYKGNLDPDADEFIEFMVDGAYRMKEMIQGLLDYSRVGTRGHEFKEFHAKTALNYALSNLGSAISETKAEITRDPLPVICADEDQIIRVFQNLIGNAIKFRRERITPKIHVSAKKKYNEYVFLVSDNGIGLEEQYSDKIFEVFKRLHAIGEYQGAGIGLAIVKRIIDRHRGRIWVKSELGKGSTFYFTIPIKEA